MREKVRLYFRVCLPAVIRGAIAAGLLLNAAVAVADHAENILLVWAGDQAHLAPGSSVSLKCRGFRPGLGSALSASLA
jgi:hypothetical protein